MSVNESGNGRVLPVRRKLLLPLFDNTPINLDGFTLTARGVQVDGKPKPVQWVAAMNFAMAAEECSPFWVGELWNYANGRADWRGQLEQILGSIGRPLQFKTLQNHGAIAKSVSPEAKELAPSIAHADAVASLEPDEQVRWLDKAKTEEMGVRELRVEIRASKRRRVIEGQATLKGMYRVIYADPPWLYGDRPPSGSGASDSFPPMTIADICKLPVEAHVLQDAVLFMWVTAPMLYENPGPREVIEAWGFKPKTGMVWDKVVTAGGHYVQSCHEHLIIATRGSCLPDHPTPQPDSVVVERRTHAFEHSEKPGVFRKVIEKLYSTGPYLELFGREPVENWDVFGNDARLWAEQVSA
jgi:N6-adenosine-specific RNA methylase IME4